MARIKVITQQPEDIYEFQDASVYVIHCTETGRRKIGQSIRPWLRAASIVGFGPTIMEIEGVIKPLDHAQNRAAWGVCSIIGRRLEHSIHKSLAANRVVGEWFDDITFKDVTNLARKAAV